MFIRLVKMCIVEVYLVFLNEVEEKEWRGEYYSGICRGNIRGNISGQCWRGILIHCCTIVFLHCLWSRIPRVRVENDHVCSLGYRVPRIR